MKILLTDKAKNCIEQINQYYSEQGYPRHGKKTRVAILNKILILKDFPLSGQLEENLEALGLGHRYLVEGHYKIIYRIGDAVVYVTDVFDTRQDPGALVEKLLHK